MQSSQSITRTVLSTKRHSSFWDPILEGRPPELSDIVMANQEEASTKSIVVSFLRGCAKQGCYYRGARDQFRKPQNPARVQAGTIPLPNGCRLLTALRHSSSPMPAVAWVVPLIAMAGSLV